MIYTFIIIIIICIAVFVFIREEDKKSLIQIEDKLRISDKMFEKELKNKFEEIQFKNDLKGYVYFPENFNWKSKERIIMLKGTDKYYIPKGIFNLTNYEIIIDGPNEDQELIVFQKKPQ